MRSSSSHRPDGCGRVRGHARRGVGGGRGRGCIDISMSSSDSSDYEDETFSAAGAGCALVTPTQAGKLKKGAHVMLKGHPCKVRPGERQCARLDVCGGLWGRAAPAEVRRAAAHVRRQITEITTSKTGKHGHAKANITGLDIFTGNKYQDMSPTSHTMWVP